MTTGVQRTSRAKHGQTHDIKNLFVSDGSQFTTGGAENPTLTIVTLAIRQADYIAREMGAKNIQASAAASGDGHLDQARRTRCFASPPLTDSCEIARSKVTNRPLFRTASASR